MIPNMKNMKNVTLFTLMSIMKIGLSNNYNCYINRPIYNPMTILPDVNNIASKCFLKNVCIYGEQLEVSTDSYIHNNQVIFLNVNELGDAGYYIRDSLHVLLQNPNITIITNDDIYHYDNNMEFKDLWNKAIQANQSHTFEERMALIKEKLMGIQFYDTRDIWRDSIEEQPISMEPLIVFFIMAFSIYIISSMK